MNRVIKTKQQKIDGFKYSARSNKNIELFAMIASTDGKVFNYGMLDKEAAIKLKELMPEHIKGNTDLPNCGFNKAFDSLRKDVGNHLKTELESIIESGHYFPYQERVQDKDHKNLYWYVYADTKDNRLFVKAHNEQNDRFIVGWIQSTLDVPLMEDRMWGIDVRDLQVVQEMSNYMYRFWKNDIITAKGA